MISGKDSNGWALSDQNDTHIVFGIVEHYDFSSSLL